MTDEQIFELASQYLKGHRNDDEYCTSEWFCEPKQLVKFARAIYRKGWRDCNDEGYI